MILTPDQRLRVFVSSTLKELVEERGAAKEAIVHLRLAPVMFELGARPHPPRELYRAYLEQSHIFIGIYWQQYGWIAPDMSISGLEDEYRLSGHRPKLIYVKTPAPEREPRLNALLDEIKNDQVSYKPFTTPAELQQLIEDDLALLLTEQYQIAQLESVNQSEVRASTRIDNLPAQTTSLIGREREITAVQELLLQLGVRLVSLTGPGGVGKTRLGIEVARRVSDQFKDGVCFVALASINNSNLFAPTVVQTLGLRDAGTLQDTRMAFDALKTFVHDKHLLLVLDNFEQLLSAVPIVAELLAAAPQLELIVTSRAALRMSGEYEFAVLPLDPPDIHHLPPTDSLGNNDSIRLFVERSQAVNSDFQLTADNATAVAGICYRLDGLPLAIELAAARTRLLPPHALLHRLTNALKLLTVGARDAPERHQTLRKTLDWSYELLDEEERILFARFAVFVNGCTLEAAEQILGMPPVRDVLEGLSSLRENSLIQRSDQDDEPRFAMLEIIREYAMGKLDASADADALRQRHAQYYATLLERAQAQDNNSRSQTWLKRFQRLQRERGNLRAAMRWLLEHGDAQTVMHLGWTLSHLWLNHVDVGELQRWMDKVLTSSDSSDPSALSARAQALSLGGAVATWQGDYARGIPMLEQGIDLFERLGDTAYRPYALMALGIALLNQGDVERGRQVLDEGLRLNQDQQIPVGISLDEMGGIKPESRSA